MALSEAAINSMLDDLATNAVYVAAHTGQPSLNPVSPTEVTGGSPAYVRKSATWNAAASKNLNSSNAPVLDIPASTTVTYIGFWNHVSTQSAATFMGEILLLPAAAFTLQGTLTLTDIDWAGV